MAIKKSKYYLAVDFGASNGRGIIAEYNGKKLGFKEVHRFENRPVFAGGTLYWDFLRLFSELKISIGKAFRDYGELSGISIDTWGFDFVLLNREKEVLSNPVHYRDKRTRDIAGKVFRLISREKLYKKTGVMVSEFNTLFQLYSLKLSNSSLLRNSKHFLMIGDLFNYLLTGNIFCEFTAASISQLLNLCKREWFEDIIKILDLPDTIFPEIAYPGTNLESLKNEIRKEIGCGKVPVSLSAYDTSSEITGIPVSPDLSNTEWAYLCCGTWSIVGIVVDEPLITNDGYLAGFGNEGGTDGKYNYLKNIVGLWIIQQCRKKWHMKNGRIIDWDEITARMIASEDKNIFIDVDDRIFEREIYDMPRNIMDYCSKTGQDKPRTIGEISRCFYESLVLKYARSILELENLTGRKFKVLHIVGGGSQNRQLCQMISDCISKLVLSGPAEATISGNLVLQMMASRDIGCIVEGKDIIKASTELHQYYPVDTEKWEIKFERYMKIMDIFH